MPELLLKLKQVPEDEHQDVLDLLIEHNIEHYETNAGFWGLGMAGIWLSDKDQYIQAKDLLAQYQATRQQKAQQEYEKAKEEGTQRTLLSTFKNQPGFFILYLVVIVALILITISPFLALMD